MSVDPTTQEQIARLGFVQTFLEKATKELEEQGAASQPSSTFQYYLRSAGRELADLEHLCVPKPAEVRPKYRVFLEDLIRRTRSGELKWAPSDFDLFVRVPLDKKRGWVFRLHPSPAYLSLDYSKDLNYHGCTLLTIYTTDASELLAELTDLVVASAGLPHSEVELQHLFKALEVEGSAV